tara:strand:- start:1217 stop:1891 length:675 start_codon:yes stop_codon:yes gene_type:complete
MKKTILLLLISVFCFELKAQKDYEAPGAKEAVKSHKTFAVLPFQFIITAKKPKKMTQEEFEENTKNAERDGRTSCQAAFASRILKKMQKGKIVAQLQPVARTNALLSRGEVTGTDIGSSKYLPEELCEILGVDAVVMGNVESAKLLSTGAAIGLKVASKFVPGLGRISSGKSSADLSLYDKDGQLLWNWATRELKTSDIGSNTDDLIDYLMKRATKKFPYFQRK